MSSILTPWEISLEFTRLNAPENPYEFSSFVPHEYLIHHTYGGPRKALFDWSSPQLQECLSELRKARPNSTKLAQLGHFLQQFLLHTSWARDEEMIDKARQQQRPIHLTIRSNAAEMYSLPWELLPLELGGTSLGELSHCLIRYEWQRSPPQAVPHMAGRILLACSGAGGDVPFDPHREAIMNACQEALSRGRVTLELLPNVTRRSLALALRDTGRPPVTVLHLLCHGTPIRQEGFGVAFNPLSEHGQPDRLDASDMRPLFSNLVSPPRLAVLTVCCSGDAGTPAHHLGGLAQMLHRQGIPAVLASRMPLSAEGSIHLTQALYDELLRGSGNLHTALSAAKQELMSASNTKDWVSLQLYAREGDGLALDPFGRSSSPAPEPSRGDLVLICHEAYAQAHAEPEAADAPALFERRQVRKVSIDQTQALENRHWEHLDTEVQRLTSPQGALRQALTERGTELVYYGFPFVPFAALAGFLAKTRHVHLFEHDRDLKRFTWLRDASGPFPPMHVETQEGPGGHAARLRLSISAEVGLHDCQAVLPEQDIRRDIHCRVEDPQRGIVRREEQAQAYAAQLRAAIDQSIAKDPLITGIHVFASVPVSIAFHLGQALTASWLPPCYVYNHGAQETPRYKWRLCLQKAAAGQPSVELLG
jgi:hypothetical protein